ncbi:hypothetical protein QL285_028685 [Trifolium repens]|nr:hypothetical protein QL285_028685 [Trifolium repens]
MTHSIKHSQQTNMNMFLFLKFLMLVVAIVGALVGNVQGGLPACCRRAGQICDPVACQRGPCCDNPPSSDMKP